MKIKARDVIPGWPRGRTTVAPWRMWWLRVPWSFRYDASEDEYHAGQQRMLSDYFERWRKPEPQSWGFRCRPVQTAEQLIEKGILGQAVGFEFDAERNIDVTELP